MTEIKSLYNYAVEVTNRFKGLDLVDRMPEELWTEVSDIVQEAVIKAIPKKKKWKKGHEFEQALGVDDGQGGLACCSLWGCKELYTTE